MVRPHLSRLAILTGCLVTIGCDRVTKQAAATLLGDAVEQSYLRDTVRLAYAENTGGFLSLGADLPPSKRMLVFTVFTAAMLAGLAIITVRSRWQGPRLLGAALIISGGASNLIDRIVTGSVIDFVNVGIGPVRTGIFNVADVAILLGVTLLIVAGDRRTKWGPSPDALSPSAPAARGPEPQRVVQSPEPGTRSL